MDERKLFRYLKTLHYPDLVMSEDQFSKWDCYSPSTNQRIELKCRDTHYNDLLIEKIKYDAMIQKTRLNLEVPVYINSTPNGIYKFNLLHIDCEWFDKDLPRQTKFNDTKPISKKVAMIPVAEAEVL
jgi:hypothetical protein